MKKWSKSLTTQKPINAINRDLRKGFSAREPFFVSMKKIKPFRFFLHQMLSILLTMRIIVFWYLWSTKLHFAVFLPTWRNQKTKWTLEISDYCKKSVWLYFARLPWSSAWDFCFLVPLIGWILTRIAWVNWFCPIVILRHLVKTVLTSLLNVSLNVYRRTQHDFSRISGLVTVAIRPDLHVPLYLRAFDLRVVFHAGCHGSLLPCNRKRGI